MLLTLCKLITSRDLSSERGPPTSRHEEMDAFVEFRNRRTWCCLTLALKTSCVIGGTTFSSCRVCLKVIGSPVACSVKCITFGRVVAAHLVASSSPSMSARVFDAGMSHSENMRPNTMSAGRAHASYESSWFRTNSRHTLIDSKTSRGLPGSAMNSRSNCSSGTWGL